MGNLHILTQPEFLLTVRGASSTSPLALNSHAGLASSKGIYYSLHRHCARDLTCMIYCSQQLTRKHQSQLIMHIAEIHIWELLTPKTDGTGFPKILKYREKTSVIQSNAVKV